MSQRLQATLSDPVMEQVEHLQKELRIDTSELVAEAISLLAKAVLEARRGARLGFKRDDEPVLREYSSPALTRLEWGEREQERVVLSGPDFDPSLRRLSRRRRSG